jgi:Cap4 dsDNA endonuclease
MVTDAAVIPYCWRFHGVTEPKRQQPDRGLEMLMKVAEAESDPTGLDTFARYVWQAKQAVRQWLTCLSERDGPLFVACEQVDDLTLIYSNRVRFVQLKTRDRGSWSAAAMCEGSDHVRELLSAEEWTGCQRGPGDAYTGPART